MPTGEKTAARFAAMRDGKQELRMRALSSITPLRIVRDVRTLRQVELDDAPLYSHVALDHHGGDQELDAFGMPLDEPPPPADPTLMVAIPVIRPAPIDDDIVAHKQPFRRPAKYITSLPPVPYMYYDMDSEDEEFLIALNAGFQSGAGNSGSEEGTEDDSASEGSFTNAAAGSSADGGSSVAQSAAEDDVDEDVFVDIDGSVSDDSESNVPKRKSVPHKMFRADGPVRGPIRTYARRSVVGMSSAANAANINSPLSGRVREALTPASTEHVNLRNAALGEDDFERLIELFEANARRLLAFDERGRRRLRRTGSGSVIPSDLSAHSTGVFFGHDEAASAAAAAAAAEDEAGIACAICGDVDSDARNEILFCDGCDVAVHQMCYGIHRIPSGSWYCNRCDATIRSSRAASRTQRGSNIPESEEPIVFDASALRTQCAFCPITTGAFKQCTDGRWAHVTCALWIPETSFVDPSLMEPIDQLELIPDKRWLASCDVCQTREGACISCSIPGCSSKFHVMCSRDAGFLLQLADDASTPTHSGLAKMQNKGRSPKGVKFIACCRKHTILAEIQRGNRGAFGMRITREVSRTLRKLLKRRRTDPLQVEANARAHLGAALGTARRRIGASDDDLSTSDSELSSDTSVSDVDTLPVPLPLFYWPLVSQQRSDTRGALAHGGNGASSSDAAPPSPVSASDSEVDNDREHSSKVFSCAKPGEPYLPWNAVVNPTLLCRCFQYWRRKRVVVANAQSRAMQQSRGDASHSVANAHSATSESYYNPQGAPLVREMKLFKRADGRLAYALTCMDATPEESYRRLRLLRRDFERVRLLLDQIQRREAVKRAAVAMTLRETELKFRMERLEIDQQLWHRQMAAMAHDAAHASLHHTEAANGDGSQISNKTKTKKKYLYAPGATRTPEMRRLVEQEKQKMIAAGEAPGSSTDRTAQARRQTSSHLSPSAEPVKKKVRTSASGQVTAATKYTSHHEKKTTKGSSFSSTAKPTSTADKNHPAKPAVAKVSTAAKKHVPKPAAAVLSAKAATAASHSSSPSSSSSSSSAAAAKKVVNRRPPTRSKGSVELDQRRILRDRFGRISSKKRH